MGRTKENNQMITFKTYISEAGQAAGKMELTTTSLEKAVAFGEKSFKDNNMELYTEIPNFDKNYTFAQGTAGKGHTKRKDMPVLDDKDIKMFQRRLEDGYLDHTAPYKADSTNKENPFPTGLSGKAAKDWLEAGLYKHDKNMEDDRIDLQTTKVAVGKLLPIQKQIYVDKSIEQISTNGGAAKARSFLESTKTTFIISKDLRILDGHHRYLSAILIDPKIMVNVIKIDMEIDKLLPLTLSYSDAVGNKRNA